MSVSPPPPNAYQLPTVVTLGPVMADGAQGYLVTRTNTVHGGVYTALFYGLNAVGFAVEYANWKCSTPVIDIPGYVGPT